MAPRMEVKSHTLPTAATYGRELAVSDLNRVRLSMHCLSFSGLPDCGGLFSLSIPPLPGMHICQHLRSTSSLPLHRLSQVRLFSALGNFSLNQATPLHQRLLQECLSRFSRVLG